MLNCNAYLGVKFSLEVCVVLVIPPWQRVQLIKSRMYKIKYHFGALRLRGG